MAKKRIDEQMLTDFREWCRVHELSITPQRTAIYSELANSKEHPCAEDIYGRVSKTFPDISLDTVYRTLTTFAEIGLIKVVEGYGEAKRYDPDMSNHHHFRCRKCNKIVDFHNERYDNLRAPREFKKGFEVTNIKVVLEGLCNKCA